MNKERVKTQTEITKKEEKYQTKEVSGGNYTKPGWMTTEERKKERKMIDRDTGMERHEETKTRTKPTNGFKLQSSNSKKSPACACFLCRSHLRRSNLKMSPKMWQIDDVFGKNEKFKKLISSRISVRWNVFPKHAQLKSYMIVHPGYDRTIGCKKSARFFVQLSPHHIIYVACVLCAFGPCTLNKQWNGCNTY